MATEPLSPKPDSEPDQLFEPLRAEEGTKPQASGQMPPLGAAILSGGAVAALMYYAFVPKSGSAHWFDWLIVAAFGVTAGVAAYRGAGRNAQERQDELLKASHRLPLGLLLMVAAAVAATVSVKEAAWGVLAIVVGALLLVSIYLLTKAGRQRRDET